MILSKQHPVTWEQLLFGLKVLVLFGTAVPLLIGIAYGSNDALTMSEQGREFYTCLGSVFSFVFPIYLAVYWWGK